MLSRPHPVVVYTGLRLAVFVVVTLLLALTGLRGFPLLGLALIVSGLVALVLLRGPRGDVSARMVQRRQQPAGTADGSGGSPRQRSRGLRGLSRRLDEGAASEDDD